MMKGIILATGSGNTFYPLRSVTSKYLLPIFDKPMIYYPLSTIIGAGIKEILVISSPEDMPKIECLLGDGDFFGVEITYAAQETPVGIADALILGEKFIGDDSVTLIWGDSVFIGADIKEHAFEAVIRAELQGKSTIFSCYRHDPQRFSVLSFNDLGQVLAIEKKSTVPSSNYCVTGIYFYPNDVIQYAKQLSPSMRGELEIVEINNIYLNRGSLYVDLFDNGFIWLSVSDIDKLFEATMLVRSTEDHQHISIGCIEAIAYSNGWISANDLYNQSITRKNRYTEYISKVVRNDIF